MSPSADTATKNIIIYMLIIYTENKMNRSDKTFYLEHFVKNTEDSEEKRFVFMVVGATVSVNHWAKCFFTLLSFRVVSYYYNQWID